MKIIGTLPPPHQMGRLENVISHSLITSGRFNVGVRTPLTPKELLKTLIEKMGSKELWIDIKGRQLRITKWAVPTYGDIELNHDVEVELPAEIYFRNAEKSSITAVQGNKIFVDPKPPYPVGAGQSVNIKSPNLKVKGYFTPEDLEYIEAAKELGIHKYMLSFVEEESDIAEMVALDSKCELIAKIESPKGLKFVADIYPHYKDNVRLMAARDDLFINLDNKIEIIDALKLIITNDPDAIVASRILTSLLERDAIVSMGDLADLHLMHGMGYRNFMLCDNLCANTNAFLEAMDILEEFKRKKRFSLRPANHE